MIDEVSDYLSSSDMSLESSNDIQKSYQIYHVIVTSETIVYS